MFSKKAGKEVARQGTVPGLIAAACCLGPLLLIVLGLVSASTALAITTYKSYFFAVALVILAITLVLAVRKRRVMICDGCDNPQQERIRIISFITLSLGLAVATYFITFYVVLPVIGPVIIDNFGGKL